MGGKSFKDILWKIFRFVFLGFMALISVGPLVWIVMSSFKSNKEIRDCEKKSVNKILL